MMGFTEIEVEAVVCLQKNQEACNERGISIPGTGAVMNNW